MFRGREDVFPKRFESKRTGKSGYQPVCRNEWIRPLCQKPKIKCGECDNRAFEPVSARSFEIVARQSKAKYVTGLSATVIRKDGHHPIIFMNCGPVRHKVDDKKQAAKRPFSHKVNVIKTTYRFPSSVDLKGYSAIHQIYEFLINNDDRNRKIVKDISKSISEGHFPVVLTERKEHLEKLKALLEEKIENIIVMRGGMGVKQRREAMSALENLPDSAEKVVLATGKYLGGRI